MQFLEWLELWPTSEWIQISEWGFPTMLAIHSVGLAAVVGLLAMLSVRVLGFGKPFPVSTFANLMVVAWIGFFFNAASGVLLFAADAPRVYANWAFLLKMACVVLGVVLAWMTSRDLNFPAYQKMSAAEAAAAGEPVVTTKLKVIAVLSLFTWFVAIVAGRLIASVADAARLSLDF
jgi:hypothetical protein